MDAYQPVLRLVFPILVGMAGLEALLLLRRRPESFDWRESAATIGVAIGHSVVGVGTRALVGAALLALWRYRLFTIPMDQALSWGGLLFASEFFYYVEHRMSHEIRWFWASHSVHHSPTRLNFSAAYRLGWTGALTGVPVILAPLILMGFPPLAVTGMLAINLLYQFWLHNEWMPKLGPLEWVLNTPSSHRVHHAMNPQYIDCNYGGILIVYDRIFGTYVAEQAPCVYGIAGAKVSYNPLRIAFAEWLAIGSDLRKARSVRAIWQALVGVPSPSACRADEARLIEERLPAH